MVICLEQGADLHMAQLMPLPLTVSCFSKIQVGFTFLVPAHLGSPRKRAVKRVCVCVYNETRDVNKTGVRDWKVSIFFLVPGKGISRLPRIESSDHPKIGLL